MLEEEKKEELLALLTGKKYRELKSQLVEMNEVDIASFIEELDSEKTVVVFRMLPKELASEVFACLEVEQQQHIITSITDNELRAIIDDLYVEMRSDMLEELPAHGRAARTSELQPGYEKTDQPVPQLPGKQRRKRHDGGVRGTQEKYDGGAGIWLYPEIWCGQGDDLHLLRHG